MIVGMSNFVGNTQILVYCLLFIYNSIQTARQNNLWDKEVVASLYNNSNT